MACERSWVLISNQRHATRPLCVTRKTNMLTFDNTLYFAAKSIGLSRVGSRKPCSLLQAARHNLREIQAEQGADGHIDPTRSCRNVIVAGPPTAKEVKRAADDLLKTANLPRKLRQDHCQAIELLFSLPANSHVEVRTFFDACMRWVADTLGLPILSAVTHHDERQPHLHVLLLPLQGGRHVGSRPIGIASLGRLREDFFQRVAGPHGLRRQGAKLHGQAKKQAIEEVFQRCDALGLRDANGPLWPIFSNALASNPLPALIALGIDPQSISANAVSIHPGSTDRTLSCVGFCAPQVFAIAQDTGSQAPAQELSGCGPRA